MSVSQGLPVHEHLLKQARLADEHEQAAVVAAAARGVVRVGRAAAQAAAHALLGPWAIVQRVRLLLLSIQEVMLRRQVQKQRSTGAGTAQGTARAPVLGGASGGTAQVRIRGGAFGGTAQVLIHSCVIPIHSLYSFAARHGRRKLLAHQSLCAADAAYSTTGEQNHGQAHTPKDLMQLTLRRSRCNT